MKTKLALAAALAAAVLVSGCDDNDSKKSTEDTQTTEAVSDNADNTPVETGDWEKDRAAQRVARLKTVATVSVTKAMDDPVLRAELTEARQVVGDAMADDGFLKMVFNVTTKEGVREVTALGYCENLIGKRDYDRECSEIFRDRLAISNTITDYGLQTVVPTNNPEIRPHALVSTQWLRRALGTSAPKDDYYFVTEISTPQPQ